jgi:hypothetical protein
MKKTIRRLSSAGEFHPRALQEPYVNLSIHTALLIQSVELPTTNFVLYKQFLPFLVGHLIRPDKLTPSLHLHYTDFITTTSCSAPVSRIGTLTLVGPPLAFLP